MNLIYKIPFFWVLNILFVCYGQTDNLIPNPSFEEHNGIPDNIAQGKKCLKTWTIPIIKGQGDYYHSRSSSKKAGTLKNHFGKQTPHSGLSYAGICISNKFREYLQVKLIQPLTKDVKYTIKIFISCADKWYLGTVSEFNVLFSEYPLFVPPKEYLLKTPQIKFQHEKKFNNNTEWTELSTTYTATGNEQYFTFGSFMYKEYGKKHGQIIGPIKYAHYYIDDVSIEAINENNWTY